MKEISCKCLITRDMRVPSDVLWGPKVEFSTMTHSPINKHRKRTTELTSRTRKRLVACLFNPWIGKRTQRFLTPSLLRDEEKIVKSRGSDSLTSRFLLSNCKNSNTGEIFSSISDLFVEEPWLLQSFPISHRVACLDNSDDIDSESDILKYTDGDIQNLKILNESGQCEDLNLKADHDVNKKDSFELYSPLSTNYHVEEPWLFEFSNPETLLHVEGSIGMTKEDSVSTVLLVNSSICTIQRIAVLENNQLVELLLEPVKNNVQCDSVYLGVVTQLAPHMKGVFLTIGKSKQGFAKIISNKQPFVFDSFHGPANESEVNGVFSKPEEQVNFHGDEAFSNGVEETDEVDEHSEDEFINDEYELIGASKENVNGSVVKHENQSVNQSLAEQVIGDLDQLQNESVHQDASIKDTDTKKDKWAHVKRGSKIIVQVVKEGLGSKGPSLTAFPKLKSRFWVLMTRCNRVGVSAKISGPERTRLRFIAKTLQPPGFGLTARTVASGHSVEELQMDLEGLLNTWQGIVDNAKAAVLAAVEGVHGAVPVMLHEAMNQTLSVVQDYFNDKVERMVVDSPRTYHQVTNYLQERAPELCDRFELYTKSTPLFDEYNIEEEINSILCKRVSLDNGGYLVIEQTEALVSIDVNGGQNMVLGQGTSPEKATLEVNLAAAKRIARELRLRNVGGIIVVDFIGMADESHKRFVYEEMRNAVMRDRSVVQVSELSNNGLMELTRKRVRPSVAFMISEPCTCCHATGRVESLENSFSKIELEIRRHLSKMERKPDVESCQPKFILRVEQHMSRYLTVGKRTKLGDLCRSHNVWILLKVARGFKRGEFELDLYTGTDQDQTEVVQSKKVGFSRLLPAATKLDGGKRRRKKCLGR